VKNVSPSVRRILGLVIALVAGTLATLIVASPASAHSNALTSVWRCDSTTGNFMVTWTLTNTETKWSGTIDKVYVTPAGSTVTGIVAQAPFPTAPGTLVGVQTVPGTATSARLGVKSTWTDGWTARAWGDKVDFKTTCTKDEPKPGVSFASKCDGSVTATLTVDSKATQPVTFTIVANGKSSTTTVAAGASSNVVIPAADAGSIAVSVGNAHLADYSWQAPADCAPVKVSSKSDCATLTVLLENPVGNSPVTATITVNAPASDPKTVTVPGGGSQSVTFNAAAGTVATVTFGSGAAAAAKVAAAAATQPITVSWVSPGATCTPTSPPNLPVTGAKLGGVIGAGAGLIVVGAGLLLFLRRRRTIATTR
jgi:hypothetical protein